MRIKCAFCGAQTDSPEAVHVIPSSQGGCSHQDGQVWACSGCRAQKQDKTPLEWWLWSQTDGAFNAGGWTVAQRLDALKAWTRIETKALQHMAEHHSSIN